MKTFPSKAIVLLAASAVVGFLVYYGLTANEFSVHNGERNSPEKRTETVNPMATKIPEGDVKAFIADVNFKQLVQEDPEAALRYVLKISDVDLRNKAIDILMRELADYDMVRAKVLLSRFSGLEKDTAALAVLPYWTQNNRQEAWAYVVKAPEKSGQIKFGEVVLKELVNSDIRYASEIVAKISPGSFRQKMQNVIIEKLADWDAEFAANYVFENFSTDKTAENLYLTRIGIEKFALQDFYAASDWLKTLPTGQKKNELATLIFRKMAISDLGSALEVFDGLQDDSKVHAAVEIASIWGEDDANAASRWIAKLGVSNVAENAAKALSSKWTEQSPDETRQWISTLPFGALRDQAAESYVQQVYKSDRVAAIDVAFTINNEALKTSTLRWTINRWMRDEPSVAIHWVKTTKDISDEFRADLLGDF